MFALFQHTFSQQDDSDEGEDDEDDEGDPKSEKNAASEYKRLIAIHAGKGKGGLSDWLRVDPNNVRRLSLSEPALEKAVDTHSKEIIRYNSVFIHPKVPLLFVMLYTRGLIHMHVAITSQWQIGS